MSTLFNLSGTLISSLSLAMTWLYTLLGLRHSTTPASGKPGLQKGLDERGEIITSLKGKQVHIPDLHSLFQSWPEATNSQLPALRLDVERTLERLFPPGMRRSKLMAADPALFGAMWWPYASLERVCMATYLSIWLFAWDDETDSLEFSHLATDFKASATFRATTLSRNRAFLGLESEATHGYLGASDAPQKTRNLILEQFAPVGEEMIEHYTIEQRKLLMKQIELFIEMSELEQEVQLSGYLPSVESYQRRRMGTSAVAVCLAIHEYTLGIKLPTQVMTSSTMRSLWDATNIIISVVNDILSIKKEVAQNQVDSLIPLLYIHHNHDIQAAVNDATEKLRDAIKRFEVAASTLLSDTTINKDMKTNIGRFIESCRYACTGNLNWSLRSGRYKLGIESLRNGITMTI